MATAKALDTAAGILTEEANRLLVRTQPLPDVLRAQDDPDDTSPALRDFLKLALDETSFALDWYLNHLHVGARRHALVFMRVHGGIPSWHALVFMRVHGGIPPWHALIFMRAHGGMPYAGARRSCGCTEASRPGMP